MNHKHLLLLFLVSATISRLPAADEGVALDGKAFFSKMAPGEVQELRTRLESLNSDIATRGVLTLEGERDKLLTGYAYLEFYDWDLYFENVYLSYYGVSTYCFTNLRAFLARQKPDGFIPRSFGTKNWGEGHHFKPFLAQLVVLGCRQTGDYEWLREGTYAALGRYLDRWFAYDFDKNGLPVWDSADANGMDNQLRRSGRRGSFFGEGVDLACYLHRELRAMAVLAAELGKADDQRAYEERAARLAETANRIFWDEAEGFYFDRNEKTGERIPVKSVVAFLPLWAGIASPKQAERLVREHLLNENEFWLAYPIATYAATEPDYYQGVRGRECNWQGNAWIPTNYMVMHGLLDYGFRDVAKELAERTFRMVLKKNAVTREFYRSDTGEGLGMNPFWGWSSLAYVMPLEAALGYNPMSLSAAPQPLLATFLDLRWPSPSP